MAISFINGKPGSGKTLYAVMLIIRELLFGNRIVVTNVPLKLGRLNEYLQQVAPGRNIPLFGPNRRLILLDDNDQARELYVKYSQEYYGTTDPDERERIFQRYEQSIKTMSVTEEAREFWKHRSLPGRRFEEDTGALIVLDELHIHFNARKWAQTGDACLHYLSQHRKFGDDLICITQALGNVDKQFRSVAEDFTMIINESKRKFGPFRGRNRFVRASYYKEPNSPRDVPFERVAFQLDAKGVASCYDTAAGVGVHGNKADTGKKPKGIPIMVMLPAGVALVAIVAGGIPWALGKMAGAWVGGGAEPARSEQPVRERRIEAVRDIRDGFAGLVPEANSSAGLLGQNPRERVTMVELPVPAIPETRAPENPLYVAGIAVLNRPGVLGRFNIFLSDGRVITEADQAIARVTRSRVEFSNGESLWIGKPYERNRVNTPLQERGQIEPTLPPVSPDSLPN